MTDDHEQQPEQTDADDALLKAAEQLQAARMEAIRTLAEARRARHEHQERGKEIESWYSATYNEAVRAGWSVDELRTMGCDEPNFRGPGRPRKAAPAKRKRSSTTNSTSAKNIPPQAPTTSATIPAPNPLTDTPT